MPTLGSLWYTMGIKDLTDADLKKIEDKLKNVGIELDTKKLTESLKKSVESYKGKDLALGVKAQFLHDSIRAALKQPEFPIKVTVNKAEAQDAVREALRRAGLQQGFTASDKRQYDAETKRLAAMQVAQAKAAASNALAQQRLARAHKTASSAASDHTKATVSLNSALRGNLTITKELGGAISAAYSVIALKNFMTKVVEIGGELEQQKLAMKAILGDEGMANTISSQINTLAVKSPFGIMELNQYAKQLTAFQIPYNELYDTMKRMADVSAAVGVDMGRIILAYGQVRAAKFLKGCLGKGTLVTMLNGSQKKVEDIVVGDVVMGDDEQGRNVLSLIRNRETMYTVSYDGGSFRCNENHILTVYNREADKIEDVYILDYLKVADKYLGIRYANGAYEYFDMTVKRDCVDDYYGFEIDGNKRFLIEDNVVTHNTELRQFTEANIPLIDMLAERFTKLKGEIVSAGDIMDMISNKEVSFEDVKAVLWELTGEGGRFYNMQEELSESVKAKWKNLADAIDLMFADIAKSTSGPLKGLAELLTELTTRWKTVGSMVVAATATYSAYRIAMLVANKAIAANNVALRLNAITVRANIKWWEVLQAKATKSLTSIGASIKRFVTSARGIITMASVGIGAVIEGLTFLWQRNSEEAKKAEQMGEDLLTASSEGAKNLKGILDSLPLSSKGLGDVELSSSVEKLRQAIKDYSTTADKDLLAALVNQKGEVASLAEQYDNLRAKAQQLKSAMDDNVSSQMSKTLAVSVEEADGGWFDDILLTNIDDFANAFNDAQKYLADIIKDNKSQIAEMVKMAKDASPAFRDMASSLKTDEQAFAELIKNYSKFAGDFDVPLKKDLFKFYSGYITEFGAERREFEQEFRQTLEKQMNLLAVSGITPDNITPEQRLNLIAWFDKLTEPLPGEGKRIAREIFEGMWKINLDDGKAERAIIDAFGRAFEAEQPELAKRLKAGMKINDLELVDYSSATMMVMKAADEVMRQMPQFTSEIQGYLNDNEFLIRIVAEWLGLNTDSDLKKMLWSSDENNLQEEASEAEKIFDQMLKGASSTRDVRDNYIKRGKDLKEQIKAAKANNAAAKELEKLLAEWDILAESFRRAHFGSLEEAIKEKSGGNKTDYLADNLKQRFKDIKDAWSEFQKWQKLEGTKSANKRIAESGLFSTLAPEDIPISEEGYIKLIRERQDELKAAGIKGYKERKALWNDLAKAESDMLYKISERNLKLALDKVSKEAERQLADWNLYEKVRKATGNETLAFNLAFGMNGDGQTDYIRLMKDKFDAIAKEYGSAFTYDTATPELLKKEGIQEVQKAYEQTYGDISKYHQKESEEVADILAKYQSLQDKLAKIDYDRNEEIRRINESKDLTPEQKAQTIQRINVEADYQKFTQSNEYLQFFAGIYALTQQEATRTGDLIEQNLNQRLQAGTISAEDYYKEIERVKQQLDKLRNVKSNAMTFLTGGFEGLNEKRKEQNDAERLKTAQEIAKLEKEHSDAVARGDMDAAFMALAQLNLAKEESKLQNEIRDKIVKNEQLLKNTLDVANLASNLAGGISDAFGAVKDIAASFGVDTDSGAWLDVGAVVDTLTSVTSGVSQVIGSLMKGDIGGAIGGVFKTIASPFTIWSDLHDKKLQKRIERSKQAAQIMQNQYDILEKQMKNFLGNAANMKVEGYSGEGGAYGKQLELMKGQLAELEKQRQAEIDKKKTDNSVVEDYDKQIEEMKISIRNFAEEVANSIYGIDLNGWAQQIGDALVDAFAKGEDAAEAFDKTVADIMRSVVKNIIATEVIAPAMEELRDDLFGDNGVFANYKTGGKFKLSAENAAGLANALKGLEGSVEESKEIWDIISNLTGGMLDDTDKAKGGLSAGIQSVTEDTADLLASYVNAIRASVAMNEGRWERLLTDSLPQISVIAQSQLDAQRQIAENTLRTAKATEDIVKSNDDISRLLTRVSQGGAKFYIQ